MSEAEITHLKARIEGLEEKIRGLRASRRVLMNLITLLERERRAKIKRLQLENDRLQKSNAKYARAVLERNARICHLERVLRQGELASTREMPSS